MGGAGPYEAWPDLDDYDFQAHPPARERPFHIQFDSRNKVCSVQGTRLVRGGDLVLETPFTYEDMIRALGEPEATKWRPLGCWGCGYEVYQYEDGQLVVSLSALDSPFELRAAQEE